MSRLGVMALAGALWMGSQAQAQTRVRVDGVAAFVRERGDAAEARLILRSDVQLRAALSSLGPKDPAREQLVAIALQEHIDELLLAHEAERIGLAEPSAPEVAAQVRVIEEKAGGQAALDAVLEAVGAERSEVEAMALLKARAASFLQTQVETTVAVSDADVQAAYEAGNHPFGDAPLAEVAPALKGLLLQKALQKSVVRWVQVLRDRASIRVLMTGGESNGR